jgi:hypothetical protein
MAYRFGDKQKSLAIGAYPVVTLGAARDKRDDAKRLLADHIDPGVAKQEAKRERAAAQMFGDWADEWLAKERLKWDSKTMAGKERFVEYLAGPGKDEDGNPIERIKQFGNLLIPAIKRRDVIDLLKEFEKEGTLETRDRVRATGERFASLPTSRAPTTIRSAI